MIQYSRVTEQPDSEPVTIAEAKVHLHVDGDSENTLIMLYIGAARRMCEAYAGLSFVTQQRSVRMDYFPECEIILPYGPVQSVESFTYTDSDGDEVEMVEDTDFKLDSHGQPCRLVAISGNSLTSWPTASGLPGSIEIIYQAGFDDVSGEATPKEAKAAILMQVGSMYENRQDEVVGSTGTQASVLNLNSQFMLDNIKVYWNANY